MELGLEGLPGHECARIAICHVYFRIPRNAHVKCVHIAHWTSSGFVTDEVKCMLDNIECPMQIDARFLSDAGMHSNTVEWATTSSLD